MSNRLARFLFYSYLSSLLPESRELSSLVQLRFPSLMSGEGIVLPFSIIGPDGVSTHSLFRVSFDLSHIKGQMNAGFINYSISVRYWVPLCSWFFSSSLTHALTMRAGPSVTKFSHTRAYAFAHLRDYVQFDLWGGYGYISLTNSKPICLLLPLSLSLWINFTMVRLRRRYLGLI